MFLPVPYYQDSSAKSVYESVPAVFLFSFNEQSQLEWKHTIPMKFNVIELAILGDRSGFVCSTDVQSHPGTTNAISTTHDSLPRHPIDVNFFTINATSKRKTSEATALATNMNRASKGLTPTAKAMDDLSLYTLHSLRKRDQEERHEQ